MNPADLHALRMLATNVFDADDHGATLVPKTKLLALLDQVAALTETLTQCQEGLIQTGMEKAALTDDLFHARQAVLTEGLTVAALTAEVKRWEDAEVAVANDPRHTKDERMGARMVGAMVRKAALVAAGGA